MSTTTLTAANGKFVCAENGGDAIGTVIANRAQAGPWETFTLEAHGTQVALKTSGGFYWCAEGGGGATLHANRKKVGPWERFTVERQPDGSIALRTSKGPYVCADLGLDGLLVADRPSVGPWERFTASYTVPPRPSHGAPVLHADGRIFRTADQAPWRYRGVSAFQLLDRWAAGEAIGPFLAAYRGFNVLRVWPYVPATDWGARAWDVRSIDVTKRFLAEMAALGWTVELTLLTDDDPARLAWAQAFVPQLAADPRPTNLLLECGNEPETHKHINTAALTGICDASGFLYASGNYEDATKMVGRYGVAHTARDAEWPRRAHDLMEYYTGGGPHSPSDPAHHFPQVADEPAKTQDVAPPAAPLGKPDDWRAYFGTAAILGAGATFHSASGRFAQLPTREEADLAAAALEALTCFPADAPNGPYSRPVEQSLRTYVVGNSCVRVRPSTQGPPPGGGWTRIGNSWILWRRS